jgi:hypothetical protein
MGPGVRPSARSVGLLSMWYACAMSKGSTTMPGYENRNGQIVVRGTGKLGTDHLQYVYVLKCKPCGHEYGANGSDIHLRKCPVCQGGAPGLAC